MRKALVEMRADRFEDLIALVALYRPGPMANIPVYCARKLGEEKVEYLHPKLEPILRETFGVITYQEQVQQIARDLAGYSLGQADILRRAMGKKIKLRDGCAARPLRLRRRRARARPGRTPIRFSTPAPNSPNTASTNPIRRLMRCSPTRPPISRPIIPVEFLAASMTLDKSNTDKLAEFRDEAQRLGIRVAPPSVNGSDVDFDVRAGADGVLSIAYALSAVKGVGEGAGRGAGRRARANAHSPRSPTSRAASIRARVNKKALESLAAAGAFDDFEPDRAGAFAAVEPVLALAAPRRAGGRRRGQSGLFGESDAARRLSARCAAWPPAERLRREFEAVGFFLSGHPLEAYAERARRGCASSRWADFVARGARRRDLGAARRERARPARAAHQDRAPSSASSSSPIRRGQYEAILFAGGPQPISRSARKRIGRAGDVAGRVSRARTCARASSMSSRSMQAAAACRRACGSSCATRRRCPRSRERLRAKGEGEVSLVVLLGAQEGEVEIRLPGRFQVSPQIAGALKAVAGRRRGRARLSGAGRFQGAARIASASARPISSLASSGEQIAPGDEIRRRLCGTPQDRPRGWGSAPRSTARRTSPEWCYDDGSQGLSGCRCHSGLAPRRTGRSPPRRDV